MSARIVSVADVYDALTNERPYKKAWSHEAAIEEMKANSGSHFDPFVFDAFVTVMRTRHVGKAA